jgi:hypothetical protein
VVLARSASLEGRTTRIQVIWSCVSASFEARFARTSG